MKSKQIVLFCFTFPVIDFFVYRFILGYSSGQAITHTIFMTTTLGVAIFFAGPKILALLHKKLDKSLPNLDLLPNENLVLAAPANYFRGIEAVGGKLTLTNQRIVFISHKFNLQNGPMQFDQASITSVQLHKKFAKGIIISTKENVHHTFIVDNRERWIELLNKFM